MSQTTPQQVGYPLQLTWCGVIARMPGPWTLR